MDDYQITTHSVLLGGGSSAPAFFKREKSKASVSPVRKPGRRGASFLGDTWLAPEVMAELIDLTCQHRFDSMAKTLSFEVLNKDREGPYTVSRLA